MSDYARLLEDIAVAAREAGEAILEIVRRGFDVEHKQDSSPVTEADRAAELIILAALARAAPGVPAIAEEEVAAGRIPAHGDTYFLVDPLDGTKEFVRGGDDYTVNIGLIVDGTPHLGAVFAPATQRLHAGLVGEGAWLEDASGRIPIHTRTPKTELVAVASKSHFNQPTADALRSVIAAEERGQDRAVERAKDEAWVDEWLEHGRRKREKVRHLNELSALERVREILR